MPGTSIVEGNDKSREMVKGELKKSFKNSVRHMKYNHSIGPHSGVGC